MVGYYYKTGAEIHGILLFMKENLGLEFVSSPSSLKTDQTNGLEKYRFSFFLNERKEIVYMIEPILCVDMTECFKEEKKITKEEALKKIEELKAFVENLDKEIPDTCGNKEYALKIMNYMNKYVKDKVKELY